EGAQGSAHAFVYLWKNLNGSVKGKTMTVVFAEPFTDWKSLLYGLLPAHYMEKVAGDWSTGLDKNPGKIPVNGLFEVSAWEQGQSLTLVRNDRYFGPKAH